jgi:hypothetical protein
MILDHLSIFKPPEGWLNRNEFEKSDGGGSGVRMAMRIKWSISSRRMNVHAVNPRMVDIQMFGSESGQEDERKKIDPAAGTVMARKSDQDDCLGKRW